MRGGSGSPRRAGRTWRVLVAAAVTALPALAGTTLAGPTAARASEGAVSAGQVVFRPTGPTILSVDGAAYRGDVVVGPAAGGLAVVNRVGFEDYVAGIAEMPPNWPEAALAAQAVAARTYALWQVLVHPAGAWDAAGGQICASDACQVYAGMAKERQPGSGAWLAAVRGTSGTVLLYQNRVIEALYGSSDGGRTVSGGVPWLPAVSDPEDAISPEHHWSWSESLASLAPALGVPAGSSLVSLVSRPDAVIATLQGPDGTTSTQPLAPADFHSLLNSRLAPPAGLPLALPSWRYSVSTSGTDVVVDGYGFGHGMGMSQYGALGKALRGWSGAQILASYYGPARPVRLAPGQEPATIGVALADGVGRVRVSATGPYRVLDGSGRTLATAGGGSWDVVPHGSGVTATAAAGTAASPPPTLPPAQVGAAGAGRASPVPGTGPGGGGEGGAGRTLAGQVVAGAQASAPGGLAPELTPVGRSAPGRAALVTVLAVALLAEAGVVTRLVRRRSAVGVAVLGGQMRVPGPDR
ncbi:MAG TPA: SpoIID/LytB domain-containing protein [Acidimicrobiales bacterium]|nr:SpoIID/LytB domain-containing protein [Acidimicrobiales bacterium]